MNIHVNGNALTHWMHLMVWNELHAMRVNNELAIDSITPEKPVLLSPKNNQNPIQLNAQQFHHPFHQLNKMINNRNGHYSGDHFFHDRVKIGSFDFLVETPEKKIGIEVLTRPSKHKMLHKLMYLNKVDEFVFVIPSNTFEFFRKTSSKSFYFHLRKKCFPQEFNSTKLKAWLLNLNSFEIEEKGRFSELFNVK